LSQHIVATQKDYRLRHRNSDCYVLPQSILSVFKRSFISLIGVFLRYRYITIVI